jgi:hypothetical protein
MLEKDGKDQLDRWCKNEEALHKVKEERNILHILTRMKANCIDKIFVGTAF